METDFWSKVEGLARTLNVPAKTLETWKRRGYVPPKRHKKFVTAAKKARISLSYDELNTVQ